MTEDVVSTQYGAAHDWRALCCQIRLPDIWYPHIWYPAENETFDTQTFDTQGYLITKHDCHVENWNTSQFKIRLRFVKFIYVHQCPYFYLPNPERVRSRVDLVTCYVVYILRTLPNQSAKTTTLLGLFLSIIATFTKSTNQGKLSTWCHVLTWCHMGGNQSKIIIWYCESAEFVYEACNNNNSGLHVKNCFFALPHDLYQNMA